MEMIKERKNFATKRLKQLLKQKHHLSVTNNEILEKANTVESYLEDVKESYSDILNSAEVDTSKTCTKLQNLNQAVQHAMVIHNAPVSQIIGDEPFPSRVSADAYFKMEEEFTSALTAYTKRQFFEGIAEMAGAHDKLRYEIMEVTNPESLLFKGESEEKMNNKRKELERLQSVYTKSQTECFDSHCSLRKIQACLYKAEENLSKIAMEPPVLDANFLSSRISELQKQCEQKSRDLKRIFEEDLVPLVEEMSELQSAKILSGNFDLKIARQDYFISKQDTVIEQLLLQNARYEFLSMLYEVEAKSHRDTYHLLTTAEKMLGKDQSSTENRISLMLPLSKKKPPRETLDSRDTFMQNVYRAVESDENRSEQKHFITCDMLRSNFEDYISNAKERGSPNTAVRDSNQREIIDNLRKRITECAGLINGSDQRNSSVKDQEAISKNIAQIEDVLATLEKSVKNTISEVDSKKKLLVSDSLKALERTLFTNFFNDPTRLKRVTTELKTRVEAIGR